MEKNIKPYLYLIIDCANCDSMNICMPKKGFKVEKVLNIMKMCK